MNNTLSLIEEIRRRAKDNKAKNVVYYLTHAFKTLDKLRNLLITLSVVGFGFLQTQSPDLRNKTTVLFALYWSVIFGILSYIANYFSALTEANYYSSIEKIFSSKAFPSDSEYNKMVEEEAAESSNKKNYYWIISLVFLCIQAVFILDALRSLM